MNATTPEVLMECVGWMLIHFVWQGLAIAFVLAVVLRRLRRGSPDHRYLAGCGALLCLAAAPVITFQMISVRMVPPPAPIAFEVAPAGAVTTKSFASATGVIEKDILVTRGAVVEKPSWRLESYLPWLVVAWLAGVLALSCRLAAGWLQIQRLRRTAGGLVDREWLARMSDLCVRVGINRSVRLLQSARIDVPMVIGWLRPVIVLPACCLTGLTAAQLESILAHELAHIRRHDYLVNLLQSFLETLLFYHPAVWWVSRRVRAERENCCDDLAVGICGDRLGYARALATLEELRPASAPFALAAGGAPLLNRIRRLAGKPEVNADRFSGWIHAGVILSVAIGLLVVNFRTTRAVAAEQVPKAVNATPIEPADSPRLVVKTFQLRVAPKDLRDALERALGDSPGATFPNDRTDYVTGIDELLTRYFVTVGVNFNSGNPIGRSMIMDDRTGILIIQASAEDLGSVTHALETLTAGLPTSPSGPRNGSWNGEADFASAGGRGYAERLGINYGVPPIIDLSIASVFAVPIPLADTPAPQDMASNALPQDIRQAPSWVRTNYVHTSSGRSVIIAKLEQIHLDAGTVIDNLQLREVLSFLREQSKLGDSEHKGINFFLDRKLLGMTAMDSTTGSLVPPSDNPDDVGDVRVSVSLKKMSLKDALDGIVRAADRPIKVSILDYGVSFSLKGLTDANSMETRVFHVDPNTFRKGLERVASIPVGNITFTSGNGGIDNAASRSSRSNLTAVLDTTTMARQYFTAAGIDLNTNSAANAGKSIYYNDRKGLLVAHAPAADLDLIAIALDALVEESPGSTPAPIDNPGKPSPTPQMIPGHPAAGQLFNQVSPTVEAKTLRSTNTMETRVFHVDRDTFRAALERVSDVSVETFRTALERAGGVATGGLNPATGIQDRRAGAYLQIDVAPGNNSVAFLDRLARNYFAATGIDFNTNNPANLGKTIFYNDRKGLLIVHAPPPDLELIAVGLEALPLMSPGATRMSFDNPAQPSLSSQVNAPGAGTNSMEPRLFYVRNTNSFDRALEQWVAIHPGAVAASAIGETNRAVWRSATLQRLLTTAGIDFAPNKLPHSDKAIIYDDRTRTFIIGARTADWDSITSVLGSLTATPPPISAVNSVSPAVAGPPPLITRVFHVDPNTFRMGLEWRLGAPPGRHATADELGLLVAQFLAKAGADFDTNNAANADKSFAYKDDRKGMLVVRATAGELDLIGNALDELNQAPPEYNIKFKLVEIDEPASGTTGFDWLFANSGVRLLTNTPATNTSLEKYVWRGADTNKTPISRPLPETTNVIATTVAAVLEPWQLSAMIKKLEQHAGVDLLTAPEITTESGRQARFEASEIVTVVIGTNATPTAGSGGADAFRTQAFAMGPSVDVIPKVSGNGTEVDVDIDASVLEFLGYDDPRMRSAGKGSPAGTATGSVTPLPHFRLRELKSNTVLGNGQTIVLGGIAPDETITMKSKVPVLGDIPLLGTVFRSSSSRTTRKNLLVFATVIRINPDGRPYDPKLDGYDPPTEGKN